MFITFEGMDGSGKTTQIQRLRARLDQEGREYLLTREPGGSPCAEAIRQVILDPVYAGMTPLCEALLYAAARAQHVREVLRPALCQGKLVLCDRYVDSSVAYQGFGRGLGAELVAELNREAADGLVPHRTYLFMLSPERARSRRGERQADRIEREGEEFFARVEEGYRRIARENPQRVLALDASQGEEEIAAQVWEDFARLVEGGADGPSPA